MRTLRTIWTLAAGLAVTSSACDNKPTLIKGGELEDAIAADAGTGTDAAVDAAVADGTLGTDAAVDAVLGDAARADAGLQADGAADAQAPDVAVADAESADVLPIPDEGAADAAQTDAAPAAPSDRDGDGVADTEDNCLDVRNPDQTNSDNNDPFGDACDPCRRTRDIVAPDGQPLDSDRDLIPDACDTCVVTPNVDQADRDGDLVGDACDTDPDVDNPNQEDGDSDGVGDVRDTCVEIPNPEQTDTDGDGWGDACDCAPADGSIHFGAEQIPCNGVDENCSTQGVVNAIFPDGRVSINAEPQCECVNGSAREVAGACANGLEICDGGVFVRVANPDNGSVETCDRVDNDCNGLVDESGAADGGPCQCQEGDERLCGPDAVGQCQPGLQRCAEGNVWSTVCEGAVEAEEELCDGVDNDCDEETDETFGLGTACQGQCGRGRLECDDDGSARCSTDADGSEFNPQIDFIDGVDNDCDRVVDNGVLPISRSGGLTGVRGDACLMPGICGEDILVPDPDSGGLALRCRAEIRQQGNPALSESAQGLCDGFDSDCDGLVDENCVCDPGSERACGEDRGECQEGVQTCNALGQWGACVGGVGPRNEVCNRLDDDCDGSRDEGLGVGQVCEGQCGRGRLECSNNAVVCVTDRSPSVETCDGEDDDCDGVIDNNPENDNGWTLVSDVPPEDDLMAEMRGNIGEPCFVPGCGRGEYVCAGARTVRCTAEDRRGELNPFDPEPRNLCDGRDNDCDGDVDDGTCECTNGTVRGCGIDAGVCQTGRQTCANGVWGSCEDETGPTVEVCDGLDQDCDGVVDNGFTGVCDPPGQCGEGRLECDGQGDARCNTGPGGSSDQSSEEVCDGVDNDCDGQTDELFRLNGVPVGGFCNALGACAFGRVVCAAPRAAGCSVASEANEDLCDGDDGDCDGVSDNQDSTRVDGQETKLGDACATENNPCQGTVQCDAAGRLVCEGQRVPGAEVQNGIDDDCDGEVDEQ